jgi:predicted enzyme related to lactoylglutathione lyase
MSDIRTYPDGVPSWVDVEQPDPQTAEDFYGRLFGWSFTTVSAPDAPHYAIASLGGRSVAGLAGADHGPAMWNTYIAVDDADETASRVSAGGGEIVLEPIDVGAAGRMAVCRDPDGVAFRLWQARELAGAELVNAPGSWNFSDLRTARPESAGFYAELFPWSVEDFFGPSKLIRRPGYGDHLESTVDPEIRTRQKSVGAPPGFEDAIGWVSPLGPGSSPHWHVSFAVADRDAVADDARRLGAEVLASEDTQWTRTAMLRDPQGAIFTASEFIPGG